MKTNILIIGLIKEITKKIAIKLAKDYDLYFADVEDMIEYNLMNEKEIENLCGLDYLNSLKTKMIKDISTYENTLINIPFSMFSSDDNSKSFKKYCTIVFINFSKHACEIYTKNLKDLKEQNENKVALLAYNERTKFCKNNSDITIKLKNCNSEVGYKKVKKYLDKYYL